MTSDGATTAARVSSSYLLPGARSTTALVSVILVPVPCRDVALIQYVKMGDGRGYAHINGQSWSILVIKYSYGYCLRFRQAYIDCILHAAQGFCMDTWTYDTPRGVAPDVPRNFIPVHTK